MQNRRARGRALRAALPLAAHAEARRDARVDGVALLREQDATRVPELLPIRYGRMLASRFAFFRGAARVMAADLASAANSGLAVQMCGDAHLSNFGTFGSPERRLVFDANDFDETLPGPFEYDVKRLIASLAVAGRDNGYRRRERRSVMTAAAARYRTAMAEFASMRDLDVWYSSIDSVELEQQVQTRLDAKRLKRLQKAFARIRTRDSVQAFGKMTETAAGRLRIKPDPPLLVPLRDLLDTREQEDVERTLRALLHEYGTTLQGDRQALLERYHLLDFARKVVGVGSVGTRCWVALLTGRDDDDPLFLQIKEAGPSVHAEFLEPSSYINQGERVVAGQRLMQAASDLFLGWQHATGIDDGLERDFYVRQFRDWKGSVEAAGMPVDGTKMYGELCAWCLARAHARSGDRIAIAGYLGSTAEFDEALADYGEAYADINEHDYAALSDAAVAGRVAAQAGV